MNEKESYSTKELLLKEAYEMTNNHWYYLKVRELNRAISHKINRKEDFKRDWIRKEAIEEDRQLEVIHLIYLVDKIDRFNLERFEKQLKQLEPEALNDIQPRYIPNQQHTDPELIQVELNSGYKLVVTQSSFLFEAPTEI